MHRRLSYAEKGKGPAEPRLPPRSARIKVPTLDNSELIKKHSLTLVGRLTNPKYQRIWSLIPFLSDHWKCETRPIGADLGQGRFQFQFASERDLIKALDNQPYHFAHWMIMLQRWEPSLSPTFPNQILFWVQVQGLPLHLWSTELLDSIACDIGTLDRSEISNTIAKMRVFINGLQPLIRKTTLEFEDGHELILDLVYEKIHNYCSTCFSLCHEKETCPEQPQTAVTPTQSRRVNRPVDRITSGCSESNLDPSLSGRSYRQDSHRSISRYNRPTLSPNRQLNERERDSESYKYRNSPSTERTLSARVPTYEVSNRDNRKREESFNTYCSREYRRYEQQSNNYRPRSNHPPRSLWIEKQGQRGEQALAMEKSESSRPVNQTIQTNNPPPPPIDLPTEALQVARDEIRDYMLQYSNCQDPTESAARKERLGQAEEQGDIEEAAASLVKSNLEAIIPDPLQALEEKTPERIPATQRLGQVSEPLSAFDRLGPVAHPMEEDITSRSVLKAQKRRLGRPPLLRNTPLSLAMMNAGIRKKRASKVTKQAKTLPHNEETSSKLNPS